ncbi:hypothetical protein SEA_FORZA_6 [Gordonia phage Forza]|uniref:Uncharacterized protein n=1 Tax=Gordonia phage Forza TaxID=2571247 RepID=A0A650EYU4_9CAUD|nr:hypothetical protein PP303_gp006 [Gordonia phage Forza]QEM41475.1 hypothetical protein SEA_BOOPY_6 [Gordonia phage Boopy]QGT54999.1 hypothetical protein SEA_FORZA_6 [Gordonia phage Forza]UXE04149.1 hypothetical protein SEA_BLUENGOLD_5 [Gordonia phage BlueNGold]
MIGRSLRSFRNAPHATSAEPTPPPRNPPRSPGGQSGVGIPEQRVVVRTEVVYVCSECGKEGHEKS